MPKHDEAKKKKKIIAIANVRLDIFLFQPGTKMTFPVLVEKLLFLFKNVLWALVIGFTETKLMP